MPPGQAAGCQQNPGGAGTACFECGSHTQPARHATGMDTAHSAWAGAHLDLALAHGACCVKLVGCELPRPPRRTVCERPGVRCLPGSTPGRVRACSVRDVGCWSGRAVPRAMDGGAGRNAHGCRRRGRAGGVRGNQRSPPLRQAARRVPSHAAHDGAGAWTATGVVHADAVSSPARQPMGSDEAPEWMDGGGGLERSCGRRCRADGGGVHRRTSRTLMGAWGTPAGCCWRRCTPRSRGW